MCFSFPLLPSPHPPASHTPRCSSQASECQQWGGSRTEPTERAGWLQDQAPHCSVANTIAFSHVPTSCLASWGWRTWETGVLALAPSTASQIVLEWARPGGSGALYGQVRGSSLVTLRTRAEEKHLDPRRVLTCRRQGFCCSYSDRRLGRRPGTVVAGESRPQHPHDNAEWISGLEGVSQVEK